MDTRTRTTPTPGGTALLGSAPVARLGYGAMQLAGPGVMGPPADRDGAIAVLRRAVELGVTHIDTSGAYGPRSTNELIRDALAPYPDGLVIATKVGATRDAAGGWPVARAPQQLREQVEGDLETLGVDVLDVVYLRLGDATGPQESGVTEPLEALVALQQEGLVRQIGLSNATGAQVAAAREITTIAAVQNRYNLAARQDDALVDLLAAAGIAFVPFFPLGGFTPLQSDRLTRVAAHRGTSTTAIALAWLLQRSPAILPIPGTSSIGHLEENVASADLVLSPEEVAALDAIGAPT